VAPLHSSLLVHPAGMASPAQYGSLWCAAPKQYSGLSFSQAPNSATNNKQTRFIRSSRPFGSGADDSTVTLEQKLQAVSRFASLTRRDCRLHAELTIDDERRSATEGHARRLRPVDASAAEETVDHFPRRGRTLIYASDVGQPVEGAPPSPEAIEFFRDADVLLHDTTYRPEDQASRRNRGFSTYEDAAAVAIAANVKTLVTFHYDQDYTDDDVDALVESCRASLAGHGINVVPAREGDELDV
jgi:ribonuclease BN (tRNA processing enzyme)